MDGIFLLLGSNLGDRLASFKVAIDLLNEAGIKVVKSSSVYETEPFGVSDQPWFYNAVLEVETSHSPQKLLEICLETELKMGRVRKIRWGERLIDIDILYYKNEIIDTAELTIPHPGITERNFTLLPLTEHWSKEMHPTLGLTQQEMLAQLKSDLICRKTNLTL